MPYGTVNADVIQTSTSGGILGAGNASIMKNRIINGAMQVAQYTTSAVTVNADAAFYAVDRFQAAGQGSDGVYTIQQSSTAPAGFANSLLATVTTVDSSIGATQQYNISQKIEGYNIADLNWGTADAKTVTLSFWVRVSITGTFSGALRNSVINRSYPYSYTISSANTWTQVSVTIAGETTGTWLTTNGNGIDVIWTLGAGTSRLGSANSWQAANYQGVTGQTQWIANSGATFYITGVQLEVGSSATGFEYVNYQTSLANCQRYYVRLSPSTYATGGAMYSNQPRFYVLAPTTMRAQCSFNASAGSTFYVQGNGSNQTPSGFANAASSTQGYYFYATGTTATVGYCFALNDAGSSYIELSAEL
jgi:hypothetical protein